MELLQLKYFCDAAEKQNFSKTAKTYNVPASDISQSIRRLERELGVELFDRSVNRVALNARGSEFYNEVKLALNMIDNAKNQVTNSGTKATINVCICVNRRPVMLAVEKFREINKDVGIITKHSIGDTAEEFDIIISDRDIGGNKFNKEKAITEDIVLAYKKGTKNIDDIKSQPFITMPVGSSLHRHTIEICNSLGFSPTVALQSDDPFYIRKCVELGLGIVLVPEFSWRGQFSKDVEYKNIGNFKRDTYIYKNNRKYESKFVLELYQMIKKEFENAY